MLSSVLGMEELVVEDIMIPTSEIIGIDINLDYKNAKKIIESTPYTRLPVYKESIDNMIGVLHLKDSYSFLDMLNKDKGNLESILQKSYFVSQSTLLMKQLREFLSSNQSIASVSYTHLTLPTILLV